MDAQQARRILDRIVGYELSPLLWKKIRRGLSAGRVQSVATRLVAEREEEIRAFQPQEYWTLEADLAGMRPKLGGFQASSTAGRRRWSCISEQEVDAVVQAGRAPSPSPSVKRQDKQRTPRPPSPPPPCSRRPPAS